MSEEAANPEDTEVEGQLYTPLAGEKQLTFRAVATGCLMAIIVSMFNIYLGLNIGWTVGGSLLAAILGFAFFAVVSPSDKLSVLETNIAQTAGSGGGSMASAGGFVAPIPAMFALGYDIPLWGLFLWSMSVAYLGVFFAVPLRAQYVDIEKLRFPTGTATANTILSLFAKAEEAVMKARVLLWVAVAAGIYTLGTHFVPEMQAPPLHDWLPIGALGVAAAWSFSLYLGPMLFGAGFLIGNRVSISLLLGAVVSWGIIGPLVKDTGWAPGSIMSYTEGARGWILWPGVAIMVGDALTSLALSWKTILRTFTGGISKDTSDDAIPTAWWTSGLALGAILVSISAYVLFDIPVWMTLIALVLSSILAAIAVRSTGETDINPVGGMGKVTQIAFGAVSPGSVSTNLMAAGIAGAGASQAGDMMQDLKTGKLLGASPRAQFKAQLLGIPFGVVGAVLAFWVFSNQFKPFTVDQCEVVKPAFVSKLAEERTTLLEEAVSLDAAGKAKAATAKRDLAANKSLDKLGLDDFTAKECEKPKPEHETFYKIKQKKALPAPAVKAWKAVAQVVSKGLDQLPKKAHWGALFGLLFGILIPVLRKVFPKASPYLPSGLAFGIAFIVPAFYSITMFLGAMVLSMWRKANPTQAEMLVFPVACGLIAGEGLMGIVNGILAILGIG